MRELLEFFGAPVRRIPWRIAAVSGVLLALTAVVGNVIAVSGPVWHALGREPGGMAVCFAAGLVGASRRREFDQGILAVIAAIVIANLVDATVIVFSLAGTHSARAVVDALDLPLPGMLLLGVPVGTMGAGIATWLSHRATVGSPNPRRTGW
jgi:hypothetical protein